MRMQSATIFLVKVLSCVLLLCLCSSAPPKGEGKGPASLRRCPFSKEEDEFIINELSSPNNALRAGDVKGWKEMSQKIHELRRAGKRGFPQDRTDDSLRFRFWKILMKDRSSHVKVPPELKERLYESSRANLPKRSELGSAQGTGYPFTQQEDEFIINELLSYSANRPICGRVSKGWTSVSRKIQELHSAGKPGFPHDRSHHSVRSRFMNVLMNDKSPYVKIPPELKEKILLDEKERAGTPANCPFTQKEDELIINELSSTIKRYTRGHVPRGWSQISQKIQELHGAGKPGFPQYRSDDSIRSHFVNILLKDKNPYVRVPPELKQRFYEAGARLAGTSSTSYPQNQQTDAQMLNEEDDEYWTDMIEELCANPENLDFSLLDDMDEE